MCISRNGAHATVSVLFFFFIFLFLKIGVTVRAHNYHQNVTVPTISFELLILLQPNIIGWYIITGRTGEGGGDGNKLSKKQVVCVVGLFCCWFVLMGVLA